AATSAEGIAIAAMVPSVAAVDAAGVPITPGLLYGDRRGRTDKAGLNPAASGEVLKMLEWTAAQAPDARGYWPAQAAAAVALGIAAADYRVFNGSEGDGEKAAESGARADQMLEFVMTAGPAARSATSCSPAVRSTHSASRSSATSKIRATRWCCAAPP